MSRDGNPLTPRQREVLLAISRGMTDEEAGFHLGISSHTVRTHRQNLLRKLKQPNSAGAVGRALRKGWIR